VHVHFEEQGSVHSNIQVVKKANIHFLRFGANGGWQGAYDTIHPNRILFPYQRALASLLQWYPTVNRFLALGVGTGTALRTVRRLHPGCEMYGLELEERVLDIAISYFESPSHRDVTYWVGDGVAFLCNVDLTFDFILVDAYLSNNIYQPCMDSQFIRVLDAALTSQGIAVCNLITKLPYSETVQDYLDTARSLFPCVCVLPVGLPGTEQNVLLILARDDRVIDTWRENMSRSTELRWWERILTPWRVKRV